jgi:hypothetical protein
MPRDAAACNGHESESLKFFGLSMGFDHVLSENCAHPFSPTSYAAAR